MVFTIGKSSYHETFVRYVNSYEIYVLVTLISLLDVGFLSNTVAPCEQTIEHLVRVIMRWKTNLTINDIEI